MRPLATAVHPSGTPPGRLHRSSGWRLRYRPVVLWATWLGLALLLAGAAGDLLYHGLAPAVAQALEPWLGPAAYRAHLVTFVGMVLMVAGVIGRGLRL